MENEREEKPTLTNLKKPRRIVISKRDTVLNDIKSGTAEGFLSMVFSILSVILFLAGIYISYRRGGKAGIEIGVVMLMTLISAGTGIVLSVLGFKNREKTRHNTEKRGLVIAIVTIVALIAVFVRGVILYTAG